MRKNQTKPKPKSERRTLWESPPHPFTDHTRLAVSALQFQRRVTHSVPPLSHIVSMEKAHLLHFLPLRLNSFCLDTGEENTAHLESSGVPERRGSRQFFLTMQRDRASPDQHSRTKRALKRCFSTGECEQVTDVRKHGS